MENFSALEKETLLGFLDDLDERFGNAGCNDFDVPNTPEGRALFAAACRHSYGQDEANREIAEAFENSGDSICCFDTMILGYLRHKLEKNL